MIPKQTAPPTPRERVKTISIAVQNSPNNLEQPPQDIICLQCPNARWKVSRIDISCFCFMHHADVYPFAEYLDCDEYRAIMEQQRIEEENRKNKKPKRRN